jgi:membrane protease YdiL (CAAX protease family)
VSALLDRFKQRKIVQWALAYLAGAFVVVQVMDALAEPLGLGVVGQRGVVALLVLGFLLALTLAWFHGEKGHQSVSGTELAVLAIIAVLGGGILTWLVRLVPPRSQCCPSPVPLPVRRRPISWSRAFTTRSRPSSRRSARWK